MQNIKFRCYEGPEDAERQYELWLRATADLPRVWRSSLVNVRCHTKPAEQHPTARIYAERPDGQLIGYIGTHPPFEWVPPSEPVRLGWTIPFGFPWTFPVDTELETELYDRMMHVTPQTYPDSRADFYIQRFRESWPRQIGFLLERGWKQLWRFPILSRKIEEKPPDTGSDIKAVTLEDLPAVCEFGQNDPLVRNAPSTESLRQSLDGGWLPWDGLRLVDGAGAFALEVRPPWAEVKLFHVGPGAGATDVLLQAITATALQVGVSEIYFAFDSDETERMGSLAERGFTDVDAGVYLAYEL